MAKPLCTGCACTHPRNKCVCRNLSLAGCPVNCDNYEPRLAPVRQSEKKPFEVPVNARYGAPMGRESTPVSGKVHLQRVPAVDGDYDPGGAYWGSVGGWWVRDDKAPYWSPAGRWSPAPLYCAWNENGATYLRAANRDEAKAMLPGCTFYR